MKGLSGSLEGFLAALKPKSVTGTQSRTFIPACVRKPRRTLLRYELCVARKTSLWLCCRDRGSESLTEEDVAE